MPKAKSVVSEVFDIIANSAHAEASKQSSVLVPVSPVDTDSVRNVVDLFVEGEDDIFEGTRKVNQSAKLMSSLLGTEPSFDFWESNRQAWELSYQAKFPKLKPESVNRAWLRLADVMKKEFGLEKPKSKGKNAGVMSERRAKEKAKLERMMDSQLQEAIAGFVDVGNFKEAAKYQSEVNRRNKEANKDSAEALKREVKIIGRCLWKITDPKRIAEIRALIPNAVYDEVVADMVANELKGKAIIAK